MARRGIYPEALLATSRAEQLERFFTRSDPHHWQVSKQLRETVLFAPQNILADAPFSKLDLMSCRNLLIYLEPEVQQKLLAAVPFRPQRRRLPDPWPLGKHRPACRPLRPISKKWRIFHRVNTARRAGTDIPVQTGQRMSEPQPVPSPVPAQHKNLTDLTRKILLEEYAPAAVVINRRYEVLHYSGPTHLYLQQPGGPPSHDLLTLALAALRPRIRAAAAKAINEGTRVNVGGIRIKRAGQPVLVRLSVQPLPGKLADERLLLVIFQDEPELPAGSGRRRRTGQGRRTSGAPAGVRTEDHARGTAEHHRGAGEQPTRNSRPPTKKSCR